MGGAITTSRRLLERYCDLTPEELAALRDPEQASGRTLARLRRDGLLDRSDGPTSHALCLAFVAYMLGQHGPLPTAVGGLITIPHWGVLRSSDPPLTTFQARALRQLAQEPLLAWGFLRHCHGQETLLSLREAGLVSGECRRGKP
ncbi:MAG: hypothetical protein H8D78_04925 [Chloroflexi bacterium]|nr:hypothetical protein [Chloroflexota bacterium]